MTNQYVLTNEKIAEKAEDLRREARNIPDPGMSNYREVMAEYKRILNDILVLIRELATP